MLRIYIVYHELKHLKMCLDTAININEILNRVLGGNSDADIDLGCEKLFYNELSDCDMPMHTYCS